MFEPQRATLRDRITPLEIRTRLQALAWALELKPSLRHHLKDTLPSGDEVVFDGCFQFGLWDDSVATHLAFRGGKVKVGRGPAAAPDVIVRFKEARHMRTFFAPGSDALHMLLNNEMKVEGNLALLYKRGRCHVFRVSLFVVEFPLCTHAVGKSETRNTWHLPGTFLSDGQAPPGNVRGGAQLPCYRDRGAA